MPPQDSAERPRRRWLPAVLLVGAAIAIAPFATDVPSERRVELLVADPASLTRLELSWQHDGEIIQRTTYRFETSSPARRRLRTSVTVVDGDYRLMLDIERRGLTRRSERRITFDGDAEVTIPIDGR